MRVGVPKETVAGERRVGLVPDAVGRLEGFDVAVEDGQIAVEQKLDFARICRPSEEG